MIILELRSSDDDKDPLEIELEDELYEYLESQCEKWDVDMGTYICQLIEFEEAPEDKKELIAEKHAIENTYTSMLRWIKQCKDERLAEVEEKLGGYHGFD